MSSSLRRHAQHAGENAFCFILNKIFDVPEGRVRQHLANMRPSPHNRTRSAFLYSDFSTESTWHSKIDTENLRTARFTRLWANPDRNAVSSPSKDEERKKRRRKCRKHAARFRRVLQIPKINPASVNARDMNVLSDFSSYKLSRDVMLITGGNSRSPLPPWNKSPAAWSIAEREWVATSVYVRSNLEITEQI